MTPTRRHLVRLAAAAALLAAPGCSLVTGDCSDEVRAVVSPPTRTLQVGESFAPTLALRRSCGGTDPVAVTVTWSSTDPGVASVVPATGVVTAVAPGTATVRGQVTGYDVPGHVVVTVVAP